MPKKYLDIIDSLKPELESKNERLIELQKEIKKLTVEVDGLKGIIGNLYMLAKTHGEVTTNGKGPTVVQEEKIKENPYDRLNFNSLVTKIIKEEDRPMTSSQIMEEYNKLVSEDRRKSRSSFSGMISQNEKRTKLYKKVENENLVGRAKQVYGLPSMFDNEEIKPEYMKKLKLETNLFG
ncbi:MAG TPA: hypothetical protein VE912_14615 [Bacteroidales bacterium]|nr:hypothetical protein [Bacteroidales bacterium]